ncbi:MAG: nickel-responsive transcriptional regulator NikR [Thermodesulfovibrionales bacterium]|nr:nickel-responsive transcriptional regulator NikR [Thermodesulfovibrionales bacterium]
MPLTRFGISLDRGLLKKFDRLVASKGYSNRSEAIRDLIRDSLVREHVSEGGEAAGTITLIYSHDTRELTDTLTDIQHKYHNMVVSSMHIHLDGHNCLEVLVVRGKASVIQKVADRLIGTRGVKHGKLSLTATGKGF